MTITQVVVPTFLPIIRNIAPRLAEGGLAISHCGCRRA
jgi:hypothetical protein